MLWLIWQMWLLLFVALVIGLAVGWRVWGAGPGSDKRDLARATDEIDRLRRQNDDLTRALAAAKKDEDKARSDISADDSAMPARTTPAHHAGNDLLVMKGLGPKAATKLREGGVTTFEQIAAWTEKDISIWDAKLNAKGRIKRDDWVGQAHAFIDEA